MQIRPFRAVRPEPSRASRVASLPYDVVSTDEARALTRDNPLSFLRVVRPEVDLDPAVDPYDAVVYETGRSNFEALIRDGSLNRDPDPGVYLYRQVRGGRGQIGVVCCCAVEDYDRDVIRKHEKTRRVKEDDRTRHLQVVAAQTGPVFLTFRDRPEIADLVEEGTRHRPLYHFDAPDGITHTVWRAPDPGRFVEAFRAVEIGYVADGHHRSASAARACAEHRTANTSHMGDEEYNWFLAVLFPASELTILPYNRVVRDLGGREPDAVLAGLRTIGTLTPTDDPTPDRPGVFCIHFEGSWHRLELDPTTIDHTDPVDSLDVALLHDRILGPLLGIGDPRTDERIDFVGGIRGTAELERRVAGGDALAVSMYPTSIEQLLAVADAGRIMPPKSTWFEPKLRSGLLVHEIERLPSAVEAPSA